MGLPGPPIVACRGPHRARSRPRPEPRRAAPAAPHRVAARPEPRRAAPRVATPRRAQAAPPARRSAPPQISPPAMVSTRASAIGCCGRRDTTQISAEPISAPEPRPWSATVADGCAAAVDSIALGDRWGDGRPRPRLAGASTAGGGTPAGRARCRGRLPPAGSAADRRLPGPPVGRRGTGPSGGR